MKILAQNYRSGELTVLDAPRPDCGAGHVLVRTEYSLISAGTELMKVRESQLSLLGMARARPDQVKKTLESVAQQGLVSTYRKVMNRLDSFTPLGYSLCGVVEEVGDEVDGFRVGQRVACAGNKYALHAEYVSIPTKLVVHVPEGVDSAHAAFTTVGAIALQAVRQSEAHLGESACVIGLGLIGQLLVMLLRAAGVAVVGVDPVGEKVDLAIRLGAAAAGAPTGETYGRVIDASRKLTSGAGFDHVFLAVSGDSPLPVSQAAELARDRGRIVDVGKCRLDLPWTDFYEKELDLRFSRSYGPGRYDPTYEELGIDYPLGYVRWTENRNMKCFVDLLRQGELDLSLLEPKTFPLAAAEQVYEALEGDAIPGVAVLFKYDTGGEVTATAAADTGKAPVVHRRASRKSEGKLRIGAIGCGNYASSMLLPHFRAREDVGLVEVAARSALSTVNARSKFGFARVSTTPASVIEAEDVDAVLILTRHDSHADLVVRALRAGKMVFVEKPLAITERQVEAVARAVSETGNDRLMVGFNRRFAPMLGDIKRVWGSSAPGTSASYRVNAGRIAGGSWYADSETQGSRFVGEGGHFIDVLSWWFESEPVEVSSTLAEGTEGSLFSTFRFANGSVGTVAYHIGGDPASPKELFEAFGQDRSARVDNFKTATVWRDGKAKRQKTWKGIDKGQRGEVDAFVQACLQGRSMPIPLSQILNTTMATLAAERSASEGRPVGTVLAKTFRASDQS